MSVFGKNIGPGLNSTAAFVEGCAGGDRRYAPVLAIVGRRSHEPHRVRREIRRQPRPGQTPIQYSLLVTGHSEGRQCRFMVPGEEDPPRRSAGGYPINNLEHDKSPATSTEQAACLERFWVGAWIHKRNAALPLSGRRKDKRPARQSVQCHWVGSAMVRAVSRAPNGPWPQACARFLILSPATSPRQPQSPIRADISDTDILETIQVIDRRTQMT